MLHSIRGAAPARWLGAASLGALVCCMAAPAPAQETAAANAAVAAPGASTPATDTSAPAGGLEEIVVTAQRRSENLQKVPIAITAVTSAYLTASGTSSVLQLEKVSPGLQVYQVAGAALPFIRGIGSNQSTPGFESPIALYIDGVYQGSKNGNIFDLGNIERIEVLKGPQGTLFGRNATGGAISIITADPSGTPFIKAEGGYGRFNEKRAKLYAGGSLTDTLSASVAVTGRWDDGFIYNRFLDIEQNPAENVVAMAKLVWRPTDKFTAKLSGSYSFNSDATVLSPHVYPGTVPIAGGAGFGPSYDKYSITLDHPTHVSVAGERYTLNMAYDLGGPSIVSITGYLEGHARSLSDSDMSRGTLQYSGAIQPYKQFSQELQLQSGPGKLTYIAGLYYMYLTEGFGKFGKGENFISAANVPSPVRPADLGPSFGGTGPASASVVGFTSLVKTDAYAAFAQATYEIFTATHLTAGIRYSREKKQLVGSSFFYTAVPGATNTNVPLYNSALTGDGLVFGTRQIAVVDKSKTFSKPTFRVALDHQFTPDILGYVSFNRGFKSGTFNPSVINQTQVAVRPEVLDAYEAGFKSELFNHRIRLNAAAYYYDYTDIQVGLITGVGVSTVQNAAAARIYGLDADITAVVTDDFTLRGGLSLINSKYKNFTNAQVFLPKIAATCAAIPPAVTIAQAQAIAASPVPAGVGGNCSYSLNATGQNLVFAPKFSANLGADYNLELGDSQRILFSGTFYYNSGYDVVPAGIDAHVSAYESATASITYYARDDRYFVRLWGENLTNDHHSTYISPQGTGFQEVNARPVTYGVTLGVKFGG